MDRRAFLLQCLAGSLAIGQLNPLLAENLGPYTTTDIYFGYGKTGIGSKIGFNLVDTLYRLQHNTHHFNFVNEPGKKTLTATTHVQNSNPEGRQLLQVTSSLMTVFPCLFKNLSYHPLKDFKPVSLIGYNAFALVIGPAVDASVQTVDDYIAWVRKNPEYREIGNTFYGSESHLASLILAREKKVALRSLYYGGTSLMVEDMLHKELAACIMVSGNAQKEIDSGVFRVIAVCSKDRHPPWPEIPTMAESGVANMNFKGWYGIMAPKQMAGKHYHYYKDVIDAARHDSEFLQVLASLSLDVQEVSPDDLAVEVAGEIASYKSLFYKYHISQV